MKMLLVIESSPTKRFLVTLQSKALIREIKSLVNKRRHSSAIVAALGKGRLEREVEHHELPEVATDLILSQRAAYWDLTRKHQTRP